MSTTVKLRVMTYNVGGGRKEPGAGLGKVAGIIRGQQPDILGVQEAMDYQDANGEWHGWVQALCEAGDFGENYSFGPAVTMSANFDARKSVMVKALYAGYTEWRHGNALYCRGGFCSLGDPPTPGGKPRSVPIYRPPVYHGTRDTDPRYALLGRADLAPVYPYVINTHLTTLNGERISARVRPIPGKAEEAALLRYTQVRRLLDLLAVERNPNEGGHGQPEAFTDGPPARLRRPVILLGDLNATESEIGIASLLVAQAGFVRLAPENEEAGTHPKSEQPIDHILVYPAEQLEDYRCWIVTGADAKEASDHNAVVADIELRFTPMTG